MRFVILAAAIVVSGCYSPINDSDAIQAAQSERMLKEATAQIGMPAIKNFREKKILKDILELRDQDGLVTFTYMENMIPTVVPGHTVMGGKLTYMGESIGYAMSAATQFTNPQKIEASAHDVGYAIIPQADPNGLFSPASAEGSWVLMRSPKTGKVEPQYTESRVVVFTFKLDFDEPLAEKP